MDAEELKSMTPDADYINLRKPLYALDGKNHVVARFDEKDMLSLETLYNVFDGNCVTKENGRHSYAIGYIGGHAVEAETFDYMMTITGIQNLTFCLYDWYDSVFENFFGFDAGEIREDTTIYDTANDILIDVRFSSKNAIQLYFYHNQIIP